MRNSIIGFFRNVRIDDWPALGENWNVWEHGFYAMCHELYLAEEVDVRYAVLEYSSWTIPRFHLELLRIASILREHVSAGKLDREN